MSDITIKSMPNRWNARAKIALVPPQRVAICLILDISAGYAHEDFESLPIEVQQQIINYANRRPASYLPVADDFVQCQFKYADAETYKPPVLVMVPRPKPQRENIRMKAIDRLRLIFESAALEPFTFSARDF